MGVYKRKIISTVNFTLPSLTPSPNYNTYLDSNTKLDIHNPINQINQNYMQSNILKKPQLAF